ncbi:MAG: methionine--tRNA ligase [Patescibacteria group bacterium]
MPNQVGNDKDVNKFYITTAINYVNGPPHIGHVLESLQADAIARYRRQRGDEVFFLTGADEHGAKIVRAAEEQGKTPKELADENAVKFKHLKKDFNLSWDDFIRTTDKKKHWPNVINLWNKLAEAGDIYKKTYKGLYCVGHEAFVTEKDLDHGKCRDHNAEPEVVEEENYFFRLSKYADQIAEKIESDELKIYPKERKNEILSFIKQGVEDISFSRPSKDLSWGIPVPNDDTHTIYVWCDALANYLYPKDQWPAELHVIGKDILRFHALFWPGMLLSAGLPLPKEIFVHGHITSEGQKMSKSLGNVVDPAELVKKYGIDPVRYYLLREIPPFNDGDFSYGKFEERYNADLANGLGNYAARVLALAKKYSVNPSVILRTESEGSKKDSSQAQNDLDSEVANFISIAEKAVVQEMEEYRIDGALDAIWELIRFGDCYINRKRPWDANQKLETRNQTIANALAILEKVGELITPFLPETAEKIKKGEGRALFPRLK